jgi:pyruvate dehydrogenase E1 component alpha subunit|tara:strand:+ start:377 stop:973 length:597 start_codon:yes stop_codon:yes gene_type:complete
MGDIVNKQYLIDFETEVKERYERGEIHSPVHLSSNNEEQLIDIFKQVDKNDWVFCSWRNHYHALLHGIPRDVLMNQIIRGKSMSVYSKEHKFYSSSIVGGILPIALGVAKSIQLKNEKNKVWCFVGDMTFESGLFHETYKYTKNFDLPLQFVVEDNNLSTNTPVDETWGKKQDIPKDVIYYQYKSDYPHHGTGNWVLF